MSKVSVFDQKWLDLVFEGRNKEYGAYQLRQQDPRTTLIALFSGIALLGALVSVPVIANLLSKDIVQTTPAGDELPPIVRELDTDMFPKKIEEPKPLTQESAAAAPRQSESTIRHTELVATSQPIDADPPKTSDFIDANPGSTTTQGTGGIDLTPTSPTGSDGTGTSVTGNDTGNNDIAIPATLDKSPAFPGGIKAFTDKVVKNFNTPDIQKEITLKVHVSFIVEKDGSMTDIKITRDPGYQLGEEALKAIKAIKTRWTPGMKNGKPVRTAYNLPILVTVR